jgi:hypothetical protein
MRNGTLYSRGSYFQRSVMRQHSLLGIFSALEHSRHCLDPTRFCPPADHPVSQAPDAVRRTGPSSQLNAAPKLRPRAKLTLAKHF